MKTIQRICRNCGKSFEAPERLVKQGRAKDCSLECSYASRRITKRRQIERLCEHCGKSFSVTQSKAAAGYGKYCSRECFHPKKSGICKNCGCEFVVPITSNRQYCSRQCANTSIEKQEQASDQIIERWGDPQKREVLMIAIRKRSDSPEWKSAAHFQKGELHPRYNGNHKARAESGRYEYKKWHAEVLKKDNYTCQKCGKRGGRLQSHHIKEWAKFPELRFDVNNGIAVCEDCHIAIHGGKRKPMTRKCDQCGQSFRPAKRATRFCSLACYGLWYRANPRKKSIRKI